MKKISTLLSLFILLTSCKGNSQNTLKRYDVKSGIVAYKITISGKTMGGTIKGEGVEQLYFKNWGAVELREEKSSQTTRIKFFGREKTEKTATHVINELDNGKSYIVDFNTKSILEREDPMMNLFKQTNKDVGDAGKSMLEASGGKKVGTEKILGYNCDVWEIVGGKQWMYKGVVLKIEMSVLGIKTIKEAVSAKFDIPVSDDHFKLPNFKITKQDNIFNDANYQGDMSDMNESLSQMQNMSFEEWKKNVVKYDDELKSMSEDELRQTYDMMQKMIKKFKN